MKVKVIRKCHVSFFARMAEISSTIKVYLFHVRIEPRVGVGAGVGVDQKLGVGVGARVGTAPPRLLTLEIMLQLASLSHGNIM